MGALTWLRRFERRVARFNKWLAPGALASNVASGSASQPIEDPALVVASLGEIEQGASRDDRDENRSTSTT